MTLQFHSSSEPPEFDELAYHHPSSLLQKELIAQNQHFLQHHSTVSATKDENMWKIFTEQTSVTVQHHFTPQIYQRGTIGAYVPVQVNYHPNSCELSDSLPFLKHLRDTNRQHYELEVASICSIMKNQPNQQKWRQVLQKYSSGMRVDAQIWWAMEVKRKGTRIISRLKKQENLNCLESVLLWELAETMKCLFKRSELRQGMTLSLDKKSSISAQSISATYKQIFCSICVTYDCPLHELSITAASSNYQYIKAQHFSSRIHKKSITLQRLLSKYDSIMREDVAQSHREGLEFKIDRLMTANSGLNENLRDNVTLNATDKEVKECQKKCSNHPGDLPSNQQYVFSRKCSELCYLGLSVAAWQSILRKPSPVVSPIMDCLIEMGVQLYGYDPCSIQILVFNPRVTVKGPKLTCCELFRYFISKKVWGSINYKFYPNQVQHLLHQPRYLSIDVEQKAVKKKRKGKNNYNSICYHYFSHSQPEDESCLNCQCRKRGYCLPECGCSKSCELMLKGCSCRGFNSCRDTKCLCFKANRACRPDICQNCAGKSTMCHNLQKQFYTPKVTLIGLSSIPGAGLGLFAGQHIVQGQFVMRYTGEVLHSQALEAFRQNIHSQSMLYSFKVSDLVSIDARVYGNSSRFINCGKAKANLRVRVVRVMEQDILVFTALRDIRQEEELLFDYNGSGQLTDFKHKYPFIQ